MRVFDEVNFYPWQSFEENNANSVYIGGAVPTLIDPGHAHLFSGVASAMARDGVDPARLKLILFTHAHPDHVEATDLFEENVLRAIGAKEYAYMKDEGKELFLAMGAQPPARPFRLLLKEGPLFLGQKEILVIETPGHSPVDPPLHEEGKGPHRGGYDFCPGRRQDGPSGRRYGPPSREPKKACEAGHRIPAPRPRRHGERPEGRAEKFRHDPF